jgi:hypothetical protein
LAFVVSVPGEGVEGFALGVTEELAGFVVEDTECFERVFVGISPAVLFVGISGGFAGVASEVSALLGGASPRKAAAPSCAITRSLAL